MTTSSGLDGVARVIVGVDTHLDEHVAVAIDHHGTRLGEYRLGTTAKGYEDLETWAIGLGQVATFGVEGTGSYGAGLARHLARCGHKVIEVNRPDRSTRRRLGKSDPLDAEMACTSYRHLPVCQPYMPSPSTLMSMAARTTGGLLPVTIASLLLPAPLLPAGIPWCTFLAGPLSF